MLLFNLTIYDIIKAGRKEINMCEIEKRLFEIQDVQYRQFHSKLMPTVDASTIIGVRVPLLRSYARELYKSGGYSDFLKALPHKYYEQNNLHAFLLEFIPDFDEAIRKTNEFLPFVDNWATCDMMSPKVFKKQPEQLLPHIIRWLDSGETYTVRFAVGMLMRYFSDELFDKKYPDLVCSIDSKEYYVKMMIAWYFATLLAKQYDDALPYIERHVLPEWTHNKAIQKAIESRRITAEQKEYLKSLKIK